MALSLREQSVISRRIKANSDLVSSNGMTLREKAKISREIKVDIALLTGVNASNDESPLTQKSDFEIWNDFEKQSAEREAKLKSDLEEIDRKSSAGEFEYKEPEALEPEITPERRLLIEEMAKRNAELRQIPNALNNSPLEISDFQKGISAAKRGDIETAKKYAETSNELGKFKIEQEIAKQQFANESDLEIFADDDLKPEGDDNIVKTAKGMKVTTGFAVVEAKNLIVSHDNQGNENPEYPYELQPRDRKRAESVAWVLKTARDLDVDSLGKTRRADSGAPIVGKDRVVESGNGRTMAIIEAYRIGTAEEYREWLIDEAASFGISQSKVEAMKKPVLVRVRKSKLDRVAFASDANADDKLAMTATEKARSDANRLDDALISRLIDGDLNSVQNRPFVLGFLQSLGDAEAAQYSTTSGEPTKQLFDRLQAAIFARAYSDDRLLEMMADDSKPEIKNIIAALNSAAPDFVKAKGLNEKQADHISAKLTDSIELSLDQEAIDTIIKATNAIMAAKDKGLTIEEYLAQTDLFGNGIDAVTGAMALFIKENNRSSGRLSVAFKEMASFVNKELESKQSLSLFGDSEPISLNDVLKAANDALQRQYGEQQELKGAVRKGGFIDLFTETRGKKELREKWLEEQNQTTQESENARTTNVNLESDSETPIDGDINETESTQDLGDLDPNSSNYRYRDTGYIAGSRKELASAMIRNAAKSGEMVRADSINFEEIEQNTREAKALITKSNLFGAVDWESAKSNGMTPAAGFLIDRIYSSIAKEPEDNPQKRRDYALGIESIRDRMEKCKTHDDVLAVLGEIKDEWQGVMMSAAESQEYQDAISVARELMEKARDAKQALNEVYQKSHKAGYRLNEVKLEQDSRTRRKWKPDPELDAKVSELSKLADVANKEYTDYRAAHPELQGKKRDLGNTSEAFDNDLEYEYRLASNKSRAIKARIQDKNILENESTRAWLAFGDKFHAVINYRGYGGSNVFTNHVGTVKIGKVDDWSWAEKDPRTVTLKGKATKEQTKFQLKVADNVERIGGKPISAESTQKLKEILGLRDVQSGNWVLKDPASAAFHVQRCAEAFSDLGDIIGIDMSNMALGGRLAMAFGARGHGGASAHYEPVHRVINLTKMSGGGSLGHEWLHSLDNMIAEIETGKPTGVEDFVSENPLLLPAGAIQQAFVKLRAEMLSGNTPETKKIDYTKNDLATAKLNFDKQVFGLQRDIKNAGNLDAAIDAINAYYSKGIRLTPKTLKNKANWTRITVAYYDAKPEGGSYAVKTGNMSSSFYMGAMALDGGKEGKYWSKTLEMFARAFQSYCEDKLAELGRKNDYLSSMADNKHYKNPLFGDRFPYPEGEERKRINTAFDELFKALNEKGTLGKVLDSLINGLSQKTSESTNKATQNTEKQEMTLDNTTIDEPVFTQFKHNAKAAIKALSKEGRGVAVAALYHKEIGDIDLRWGETSDDARAKGSGLAKIIKWHPEVLSDLQGFISGLKIKQKHKNYIHLSSANGKAGIKLDWEGKTGHWLVTAYVKGKDVRASKSSPAVLDNTSELFLATPDNANDLIIGFECVEVNAPVLDSVTPPHQKPVKPQQPFTLQSFMRGLRF